MKSILIVCLCMWGLLVYGEKNNTVHLYGSLKEFKAAEVNMAPDGAAGEISDAGVIKIPVDADGNFDLVLPLSKPAYFRIGRIPVSDSRRRTKSIFGYFPAAKYIRGKAWKPILI
ncbi:MAG: hypothetical protein ACLTHQ_02095 [Odoribacter splanchnicus]